MHMQIELNSPEQEENKIQLFAVNDGLEKQILYLKNKLLAPYNNNGENSLWGVLIPLMRLDRI